MKLWTPPRPTVIAAQQMPQWRTMQQQQQQSNHRVCRCWCGASPDIDFTLSGIDATLCSTCRQICNSGFQMTALAIDGTYTIGVTSASCSLLRYAPSPLTVSGAGTQEDYFHFAGVCTPTLLQSNTCDQLELWTDLNCTAANLNDAGLPRIDLIQVKVKFRTCETVWPDGFGNNLLTVPEVAFYYNRADNGGDYYPGDAVPNFATCAAGGVAGCTIASGGTVTIERAA